MKKIFITVTLFLLMNCSAASAQDVYASSKDGFDYYVRAETVNAKEYSQRDEKNGKIYHIMEVTGDVKKVRDGEAIELQHWRFASVNHRTWQYNFIDKDGNKWHGSFSTVESLYAMEILSAMNTKYWKWK